jgi:hypothetical protein
MDQDIKIQVTRELSDVLEQISNLTIEEDDTLTRVGELMGDLDSQEKSLIQIKKKLEQYQFALSTIQESISNILKMLEQN